MNDLTRTCTHSLRKPARSAAIALLFAGLLPAAAAQAAEITVRTNGLRFDPPDVTINVGDTIRWINTGGFHDVVADDGSYSFPAGAGWTVSRTFTTPGQSLYYCAVHSVPGANPANSMNGRINVIGAPAVAINRGMSGAWFEPATSGQGMLIDVDPATNFMFVAWFTYEQAPAGVVPKIGSPDNRWLTAQGNYTGSVADLSLFKTGGGRFDIGGGTTTTPSGTLRLSFTSCSAAVATYTITPGPLTSTIDLQRVLPGTQTACETAAAAESVVWD